MVSLQKLQRRRGSGTHTICPEFCHEGKGRNGLEAAGEVGKERADLFCLVFRTMRELTARVQAGKRDLEGEKANLVLPETQRRHDLE